MGKSQLKESGWGTPEIRGADYAARRVKVALDLGRPRRQRREMLQLLGSGLALVTLLAAMLAALELGRRIGQRRRREDQEGSHSGVGALEGAVFGLMGLLIAFTFSGASMRFDARRDLLLKEAGAIGTAWQRLDLLPGPARDALRAEFRRYVDLRLAATKSDAEQDDGATGATQQRIWRGAVAAVQKESAPGTAGLVLPALNEMFDIATARFLAARTHPPSIVYCMLLTLAVVCAMLAGYGMAGSKRRSWLHILCFAGSLLMTIYVTMEIEFPRRGLIRIDRYDQLLVELRASMR